MRVTEVNNGMDVIDSRDVIARIDELESDREALVIEFGTETIDTAERALKEWDESEDGEELKTLKALAEQCEGYGDWSHGETLIRESYFTEYCEDLVSDIGDLPREVPGYIVIDWEATAENLKAGYMTVEFDGVDYLMRA